MCTYNGAKYVEEQLESIVHQSYAPFQIIISDDASTDNTLEILEKWSVKYPDLIEIYPHEKNLGYNKNFEFALSKATGDYIALSDQDDVWYPEKLEVVKQFIIDCPDCKIFHHNENTLREKDENKDSHPNYWSPYEGKDVSIGFVLNRFTGHKLIFASSLLEFILPFPDRIIYDWWIFVVSCVHGRTKYIDSALMDYRLHDQSAYFSNVSKQLADVTIPVRIALQAFATIKGMNRRDRQNLEKLIYYYDRHIPQKFDWQLFLFFFKKRNYFFRDFHTDVNGWRRQLFLARMCRAFSKW